MAWSRSRISSWSVSQRDATDRNARLRRAGGVVSGSPARSRAHVRRPLQRREPAELGAEFVGGGVGQAVHLVRGRGAGLHRAGAGEP